MNTIQKTRQFAIHIIRHKVSLYHITSDHLHGREGAIERDVYYLDLNYWPKILNLAID